jgi:hypothetical protein
MTVPLTIDSYGPSMVSVAKLGDSQDDILDQSIRDSYDDLK